jgi:hypothetical protein
VSDTAELLRTCQQNDRDRIELIMKNGQAARASTDKIILYVFTIFMLVMTTVYMAWNIHHVHNLRRSVDTIVREQTTAEGKAQLFFNAVRKLKKQEEK